VGLKGYFIQYKFLIPEEIKHSSYTYQKLFRALYGYTQNVTKSNGKTYKYHRNGVLSLSPYIRPGKNCVIIPPNIFSSLIDFFKTGKNPSHKWVIKGNWRAVYYMNEKDVQLEDAIVAAEELLDRMYVLSTSQEHEKLASEITNLLSLKSKGEKIDLGYKQMLLEEAQKITSLEWVSVLAQKSEKLKKFSQSVSELKSL
jgi:hypothetical protein